MKCSIVTINYNNKVGLEKTIQSVMVQTSKDFEYIIIYGGSTDGSLELIKENAKNLTYWVSEKDNGIYHAMNKGIVQAKGDYLLYLNSGDVLFNNQALHNFGEKVSQETDILFGDLVVEDDKQTVVYEHPDIITFDYFYKGFSITHPSSFIKKGLFNRVGLYSEEFQIISDWDFFTKAVCIYNATYTHIPVIVSVFKSDGISSKPENKALIEKEKAISLENNFKAFLPDYYRLNKVDNLVYSSLLAKGIRKIIGKKWFKIFTQTGTYKTINQYGKVL